MLVLTVVSGSKSLDSGRSHGGDHSEVGGVVLDEALDGPV